MAGTTQEMNLPAGLCIPEIVCEFNIKTLYRCARYYRKALKDYSDPDDLGEALRKLANKLVTDMKYDNSGKTITFDQIELLRFIRSIEKNFEDDDYVILLTMLEWQNIFPTDHQFMTPADNISKDVATAEIEEIPSEQQPVDFKPFDFSTLEDYLNIDHKLRYQYYCIMYGGSQQLDFEIYYTRLLKLISHRCRKDSYIIDMYEATSWFNDYLIDFPMSDVDNLIDLFQQRAIADGCYVYTTHCRFARSTIIEHQLTVETDQEILERYPIEQQFERRYTKKEHYEIIIRDGIRLYASSYASFKHRFQLPIELDQEHYKIFVRLKHLLVAYDKDRSPERTIFKEALNRCNVEIWRATYLHRMIEIQGETAVMVDGTRFHIKDFDAIMNYVRQHPVKRTTIQQSGLGGFGQDLVNKYTEQLKSALLLSKAKIILDMAQIGTLALAILQLMVSIISCTYYGHGTHNILGLIIAIGQVLSHSAIVLGNRYIMNESGAILESITNLTSSYLGVDQPQQQSMAYIELAISTICGLIGVGIAGATMFGAKWSESASKQLVDSVKFRNALKTTVADSREYVEAVAETCFNIQLSPTAQLFDKVREATEELATWLAKPTAMLLANPTELPKFGAAIAKAESMYTSFRQRSNTLENRYQSALNLLFANLTKANEKLAEVRRLRSQERVKQEPPCFFFVGRPGAGKTHCINSWLIPKLQQRMGWTEDKYVIDFGGQKEFWPLYRGEEVAFFDEAFALKEEDPLMPHLNRICSTEHNVIPGAALGTKDQECLFKVLLLGSNVHYINLRSKLATDAERALYSRLIRIEIVNRTCPPDDDYDRNLVQHTTEMNELEFRRYLKPAGPKSQNARSLTKPGVKTETLEDPYKLMTKEEVLDEMVDMIMRKQNEFQRFNAKTEAPKDNMGYFIPKDSTVLEHKPVIANLITEAKTIPKPQQTTTSLHIKIDGYEYTAEMFEQFIMTFMREIRENIRTEQEVIGFITKVDIAIRQSQHLFDQDSVLTLLCSQIQEFFSHDANRLRLENRIQQHQIRLTACTALPPTDPEILEIHKAMKEDQDELNKYQQRCYFTIPATQAWLDFFKKYRKAITGGNRQYQFELIYNDITKNAPTINIQTPVPPVAPQVNIVKTAIEVSQIMAEPHEIPRKVLFSLEPEVTVSVDEPQIPQDPSQSTSQEDHEVITVQAQVHNEAEPSTSQDQHAESDDQLPDDDGWTDNDYILYPIEEQEQMLQNTKLPAKKNWSPKKIRGVILADLKGLRKKAEIVRKDYDAKKASIPTCKDKGDLYSYDFAEFLVRCRDISLNMQLLDDEEFVKTLRTPMREITDLLPPVMIPYPGLRELVDKFPAEQQHFDVQEHVVVYIHGQPGYGKSTIARIAAMRLSEMTKLPWVDIKMEELKDVNIYTPTIIVLNDKVSNEASFANWYDTLPTGCILFNTNNFVASRHQNAFKRLMNRFLPMGQAHYTIDSPSQVPGYARRCGLPGYIYHAGQMSYVNRDLRMEVFFPSKGKFLVDGENLSQNEFTRRIFDMYAKLSSERGQIVIDAVDRFTEPFEADLDLKADTVDTLKDCVQSARRMIEGYLRPSETLTVRISPTLKKSEFQFDANQFVLPRCENIDDIKEMAIKTYSVLRLGGSDYTAKIHAPGLEIRCTNGKISYCTQVHEPSLTWEVREHNGSLCISVIELDQDGQREVGLYNARSIMSSFAYGFQTLYPETPEFKHMQFLIKNREAIQKHRLLLPYVVVAAPVKINTEIITKEFSIFQSVWETFKKSAIFKLILIIGCILISLAAFLVLYQVGAIIMRIFGGKAEEKKYPEYVTYDGKKYAIEAVVAGNMVNFTVTPPEGEETPVNEITPILETFVSITHGEKYNLGNIYGVSTQFGSVNVHDKKDKVKKQPVRLVVNSAPQQSMLDNEGHTAVRERILKAQVVVEYGLRRMYGLRWKGHDILFPAHIVTNKERVINVYLPTKVGQDTYAITIEPAMVYFTDYNNDIACARLIDQKTIPAAKDITKYFHKTTQVNRIKNALLMKRCGQCDGFKYYNQTVEAYSGNFSVVRHNAKSVNATPNTCLEFMMAQVRAIPTKAGDCGSPYVTMDSTCNTAMIIGMHTNIDVTGRKSYGNVISQEYLAEIAPNNITKQQCSYKQIPVDFSTVSHPAFEPVCDKWVFEDCYFDAISGLESGEGEIFYDAEDRPDKNLYFIGKEKKFKPSWIGKPSHSPTPWAEDLEAIQPTLAPDITKQGYLSVVSVKDHSDPSSLPNLDGRPSVIAAQIDMFSDYIPWGDYQQHLLEEALPMYIAKIDKDYGRRFRILSDLETINGLFFVKDEFYGHLDAMDLDTSSGDYPSRFYNITQKRALFQKIDYPSDRDVYNWIDTPVADAIRESVRFAEEKALEGVRIVYPAKDSMKFELQAKPNKSRCFQCLSIQDVMLVRKYSGTFQSIVAQKHLEGTCTVGIDPVIGFHQLMTRFKKKSMYGQAGDYKRWDKHVLAQLIKAVLKDLGERIAEANPDIREEITNVYKVITDIIVYTLCICDGYWYIKMRGNPSGNALTSIMNSLINLLMTYMSAVHIVNEHNKFIQNEPTDLEILQNYGEKFRAKLPLMRKKVNNIFEFFEKYVDMVYNGDDELMVIHPDYLWLVNFDTMHAFYTEILGIDYDSPSKDGIHTTYDELTNLSYLSRTFREQNGTILPALKVETVNAFVYWARDNTPKQWETLFECAIAEAVLHPKSYYDQMRKVILWIIDWCRKNNYDIAYVPPLYETKLQETVTMIRNGRSIGSVLTPTDHRMVIRYENSGKPCKIIKATQIIRAKTKTEQSLENQVYKDLNSMGNAQGHKEAIMTNKTVYDELVKIHNDLENIFKNWQGRFLTGYHPFPALIMTSSGNKISVGFRADSYNMTDAHQVQSDVIKYITTQVNLKLHNISICHRIVCYQNQTTTPIWQLQFTSMATTAVDRLMATQLVLEEIPTSGRTQQSTGTTGLNMVEEKVSENDADVTMPITQGTVRGILTKAPIWHLNLIETAMQYRETLDSPLRVAMGTPVHAVVDKISYGDISTFPTCMRWWLYSHESGAPTFWIEYKFISAATIVNQLIVGIADTNKSTYTMEELQQIEGVVINPQEGTIAVPLKLAATDTNNWAPTRITFTQDKINGTDKDPIMVPTLVLMTATQIQNAYANDAVQVNIRKKAKLGSMKEPYFVTSRSLTRMRTLLGGTPSVSFSAFDTFANVMGLPSGYPIYVTLDGSYLNAHVTSPSIVATQKLLPTPRRDWREGRVTLTFNAYNRDRGIASYSLPTGGPVWAIPKSVAHAHAYANSITLIDPSTSTIAKMESVLATEYYPFPCNEEFIFMTQGGAQLPSASITEYLPDGLDTFGDLMDILTQYLTNIDAEYSYTISEFAKSPEVTLRDYLRRVFFDFKTQPDTMERDRGTTEVDKTVPIEWKCTFKYVVELSHPSKPSVTFYAGESKKLKETQDYPRYIYVNNRTGVESFNLDDAYYKLTSNNSAFISVSYYPSRSASADTVLAGEPSRVISVHYKPVSTLGSTMSKLILANTLPKTVPTTVAKGQGGVEIKDDYCYQQLKLYMLRQGITEIKDTVITFQLMMQSGSGAVATVIYDYDTDECYVINKPITDNDRYKTLRKLTAENISVGNFQQINKFTSSIDATDTSLWIDRVVADTAPGVYTGSFISTIKLTSVPTSTKTLQSEAMLPLLMAGQQGGNFLQMIMQYFMMKSQMSLQQQQKLEQMEKEFQYKLSLQKNNQEWRELMAGLGNPITQAPSSQISKYPGLGFSSDTLRPDVGNNANTSAETPSNSDNDNFDEQMAKFKDMLYSTIPTPVESVEQQDVGATAREPDQPTSEELADILKHGLEITPGDAKSSTPPEDIFHDVNPITEAYNTSIAPTKPKFESYSRADTTSPMWHMHLM